MSNSPLPKKSDNKPEVQFTADNIGRWASRQENPFAEQNRKAAAKKQRDNEERKKATPIVAIILGVAAVIAAVGGLVALIVFLINSQPDESLPEISGSTLESSTEYYDVLQNFFNQHHDLQVVEDALDAKIDAASDEQIANMTKLAGMVFYLKNNSASNAQQLGEQIDPETLELTARSRYYYLMMTAYHELGDADKSQTYRELNYATNLEIGGNGG